MLGVAEPETVKYLVESEGVKGSPGVQWGGGFAWTDVRNIVQVHIGNVGWGDGVYFS